MKRNIVGVGGPKEAVDSTWLTGTGALIFNLSTLWIFLVQTPPPPPSPRSSLSKSLYSLMTGWCWEGDNIKLHHLFRLKLGRSWKGERKEGMHFKKLLLIFLCQTKGEIFWWEKIKYNWKIKPLYIDSFKLGKCLLNDFFCIQDWAHTSWLLQPTIWKAIELKSTDTNWMP